MNEESRIGTPGGDYAGQVHRLQAELDFYKQRETDICKAVGGVSDNGKYRNDVIEHLDMLYKEHKLMKDYIRSFITEGEAVEKASEAAASAFTPAVFHGFLVIARRLISRVHL